MIDSKKKNGGAAGNGGKKQKRYTKEFKDGAVKLVVEQGMSQSQVGRDLGVNPNLISRWVRQSESDGESAFRGKGRLKPQEDQVRKLEQQLKRMTMERDILKKAMAYFVDVQK